jgi:hypothetical protein
MKKNKKVRRDPRIFVVFRIARWLLIERNGMRRATAPATLYMEGNNNMATNNAIIYFLREAKFRGKNAERSYYAQTHSLLTIDTEGLIRYMAGKNTTITRHDILGVLDLLADSVGELLASGYAVRTDIFNASLAVRGNFVSKEDSFDRKRHELRATLSPGARLSKRIAACARPAKVRRPERVPQIHSVYDFGTKSTGRMLTAGHSVELRGAYLVSYDRTAHHDRGADIVAPGQGIFFIDTKTGMRAGRATVVRQTPSALIFNVPELPEDREYTIAVVRAYGAELREGRFRVPVRIVPRPPATGSNAALPLASRPVPVERNTDRWYPIPPSSVCYTKPSRGRDRPHVPIPPRRRRTAPALRTRAAGTGTARARGEPRRIANRDK